MAGFIGQAENTLDGKGRLPVPAKMRRRLSPDAKQTFVATRGFDRCVFLYPLNVWEEIEQRISEKNQFVTENRIFARTLLRWADELTLDSQGRVALPKSLIEFAGLQPTQKVRVLGISERLEVWDLDALDAHDEAQEQSYESLAERVMGGI